MAATKDELVEVYSQVIDELFDHWDEVDAKNSPLRQPAARGGSPFGSKDLARIALVKGLACYVFDTAKAINTLHAARQMNASIPLVRLAYESAMNVSVLVQSLEQHGVDAFMKEYSRQRLALQTDATQSPSDIFRQGAPDISGVDGSEFQNTTDTVRHFKQVCLDLTPGGPDAYLWYRFLWPTRTRASALQTSTTKTPISPDCRFSTRKPTRHSPKGFYCFSLRLRCYGVRGRIPT